MFVSKLDIVNFRGIRRGTIPLQPFTSLIGPNNCGKTTIVEALALVLGRDRLVRSLTEHDFNGSNPKAEDRILLVATLTGFASNDPERHTDWFRLGRASIRWLDLASGAMKASNDLPSDRLACQIAFAARFDLESLEPVTVRYFYDGDDTADPFDENEPVTTVPAELIKQIGFFLVPASRTWDRMISFGSELFRRVVSYVGGRPAIAVLAERERVRAPDPALESDAGLVDLVKSIDADLKALFGKRTELKLRLTTTDSEGILEAIVPHFSHGDEIPLPSRRHGSGLISLQTLILLVRFGHMRVARGEGFMMVIEEPELHVPPPLQRKLLHLVRSMTTQTVVTTHSPTIAAIPEPHEISLVVNAAGDLRSTPLLARPLAPTADNCVRNLMLSGREPTVLALMHPCVLIPEGKLDASWLRLFVKCLELGDTKATDPAFNFSHEIGVIPTPDARTIDAYELLRSVHPNLVCLFDGDQAGRDYVDNACRLPTPPRMVIRWADGWAIEQVVCWIADADPAALNVQELLDAGVPQNVPNLAAALGDRQVLKRDEIVHAMIVDALSMSGRCRARVAHVLCLLADISSGRPPAPHSAVCEQRGATMVWTISNAFDGI
jgi:predicted ATPase